MLVGEVPCPVVVNPFAALSACSLFELAPIFEEKMVVKSLGTNKQPLDA